MRHDQPRPALGGALAGGGLSRRPYTPAHIRNRILSTSTRRTHRLPLAQRGSRLAHGSDRLDFQITCAQRAETYIGSAGFDR